MWASFPTEKAFFGGIVGTALAAVRENAKFHGVQFVEDDAHIVPKSAQISVGNAVLSVPQKFGIRNFVQAPPMTDYIL